MTTVRLEKVFAHWRFKKWVSHVERFMDYCALFPVHGNGFVGLSGGRDSVTLLLTLKAIFLHRSMPPLRALHVNHGLRPESAVEEDFVRNLCQNLQVDLSVHRAGLAKGGNVEQRARKIRMDFFKSCAGKGERVYLGHHIDDSLEWSLLSKFKSGNPRGQLGIPVINGVLARPFMSVSRHQINGMVKELGLPFCEDSSNLDLRFERNFIRRQIIPPLAQRFPGYLRHYVASSNLTAKDQGLCRQDSKNFLTFPLPPAGIALFNATFANDFCGAEGEIRKIIVQLSDRTKSRGSLGRQIDKIIAAAKKGEGGPLSFSAGVEAFIGPGTLFFVSRHHLSLWKEWDAFYLRRLQNWRGDVAPLERKDLLARLSRVPFPSFAFSKSPVADGLPSRRKIHPLLPKCGEFCLQQKLWFAPITLLYRKGGLGPWSVLT